MTTFVPTNQEIGEYDNEQAIQHLQGGAVPGVPAHVLHGAWGTANVPAGRDTGGGGRAGTVVAFVERGYFKYMVHNDEEGKDYCTGFAFEGEFVADFPYCLDGDVSEVSIEADMPCKVCIISGRELQELFDSDPKMMLHNVRILKNLFKMVYGRDLDHYRYTARSRYRRLLERCPQVVQMLSLKDIASFLNITPSYLSTLRKEMTYETRAEGKRACTMPRKKE